MISWITVKIMQTINCSFILVNEMGIKMNDTVTMKKS